MVLGTDNPFAQPQASFKFPVQPPDVDPDDGDSAVVCFSLAWLPYLLGAAQQLTLQATWKDDVVDMQLTLDRAQELLYLLALPTPTCPDVLIVKGMRYNPDDDVVEQTFDGGATYVPAPGLDPRISPVFLYPPPGGLDPQCQAAANMTRFIENLIEVTLNNLAFGADAVGIALVLLPLIVTLGPFGILFDLVLALAIGLAALGATIISAAFTPAVYDALRCIFFCYIDSSGLLIPGSKEAIEAEISSELDSTVQIVTSAMFLLMGEVGLSNTGSQGDAPADCDDCTCFWCYLFDWTTGEEGWELGPSGAGSFNAAGENWHGTPLGGTTVAADIVRDFDPTEIVQVSINFSVSDNGGARPTMWLYLGGVEQLRLDSDYPAHTVSDPAVQLYEFGPVLADQVRIFNSTFDLDGTSSINAVALMGNDVNPFGADNC